VHVLLSLSLVTHTLPMHANPRHLSHITIRLGIKHSCFALQVMSKDGNLIDLADSALSGNVRIFGEIDPEWEVDPKSIVFQEKVRCLKP
jgi:hypothetical protein